MTELRRFGGPMDGSYDLVNDDDDDEPLESTEEDFLFGRETRELSSMPTETKRRVERDGRGCCPKKPCICLLGTCCTIFACLALITALVIIIPFVVEAMKPKVLQNLHPGALSSSTPPLPTPSL